MRETPLVELFEDLEIWEKIQRKLPYLFGLAQAESSRAGKVGMEVGRLREQILVALLMYKFGEENVSVNIPPTEPEVDVFVYGNPVSIKTVTGSGGVKVVWTVDWEKVREFCEQYKPRYDILLAQVKWGEKGGLFLVPVGAQREVFRQLGKGQYLYVPRRGTNPRGIEISRKALRKLLSHPRTKCIPIEWREQHFEPSTPYKRWLEYWREG